MSAAHAADSAAWYAEWAAAVDAAEYAALAAANAKEKENE